MTDRIRQSTTLLKKTIYRNIPLNNEFKEFFFTAKYSKFRQFAVRKTRKKMKKTVNFVISRFRYLTVYYGIFI